MVALVTGGAGGIGTAISESIASFGAEVIICGRNGKKDENVANRIIEVGEKARSESLDITDIERTNKFVDSLDKSYGKINVNAITSTFIRTELLRKYLNYPDFYNALLKRIPLRRVGEPIDISSVAMYLSSPASDFITGQIIFVDSGLTACQ